MGSGNIINPWGVGATEPPGRDSKREVASLTEKEGKAPAVSPVEPGVEPGGTTGGLLAEIALRRLASKTSNLVSTFFPRLAMFDSLVF